MLQVASILNGTGFSNSANRSLRFFFYSLTVALRRQQLINTSLSLLCREKLTIILCSTCNHHVDSFAPIIQHDSIQVDASGLIFLVENVISLR